MPVLTETVETILRELHQIDRRSRLCVAPARFRAAFSPDRICRVPRALGASQPQLST